MPNDKRRPEPEEWITGEQRVALMREGVVVLASSVDRGRRRLEIVSPLSRAAERAAAAVGPDVDVELIGDAPRFISPIRCIGHMEREEGRLQLRIVVGERQHVDEILVAEDADTVVVYATACYPASWDLGDRCDCPFHVYLDRPLGDRTVLDGAFGCEVPYRNVWAEIEAGEAA